MARRLSGGLTIPEVLVAGGILLLLFGAISMIYSSGTKVWRKVDLRTSLLRELQAAARHLERDLEVSHPFGLARAENALAYLSATDENDSLLFDDQGQLLWQRFIVVYVDPDGRLRRRSLVQNPPRVQPPAFTEIFGTTLESYLGSSSGQDRYLTHSGKIVRLELENAGNYGSLFQLTIEAEHQRTSTEVENLSVQTKVSLRNS